MQEAIYSTCDIRIRAVQAVLDGMSKAQVADAYGIDRITLYRWLVRFREGGGVAALERRPGSGRPRLLQQLTYKQWRQLVLQPASNFGFETDFWTAGRLHLVLRDQWQLEVSQRTIIRRLQEAGLSYQKPEREYFQMDPKARDEWLTTTLPVIRETLRKFRAILYCEDEASVSLTAFLGKTWAIRGQTPKQRVTGARGAVSAMSAINGKGRLVFRLHDKRICSAEVIDFLGQLLRHHAKRHVIVVMDQAPPHVSKLTKTYIAGQKRLHVFHLPTYSPDWNPDEKVWNHLKHHELKGHQARTKEELAKLATTKLEAMSENPELLRGIFFRCCVADLLS
jgi:transposase